MPEDGELSQRHGVGKKVSASGNLWLLPIHKESFFIFLLRGKKYRVAYAFLQYKSQNHKKAEVAGDFGRSSSKNPLLREGHLQPVPENHLQMTLEYLQ